MECIFISGSFNEPLTLIAKDLNVSHILSTHLEKDNYRDTRNIIPPKTIGSEKTLALFLAQNQGDTNQCFAYGNDISDVSMIEMVCFPR